MKGISSFAADGGRLNLLLVFDFDFVFAIWVALFWDGGRLRHLL